MKTFIIKSPLKFLVKKRMLLINLLIVTSIIFFFISSCIKEDSSVRLVLPVLTTVDSSLTVVTSTSVISGGNITSDGGYDITARGICLSVKANPSLALDTLGLPVDTLTVDGTGKGEYTSTVSILAANKIYHIRAYATNSQGTTYGQDVSIITLAK